MFKRNHKHPKWQPDDAEKLMWNIVKGFIAILLVGSGALLDREAAPYNNYPAMHMASAATIKKNNAAMITEENKIQSDYQKIITANKPFSGANQLVEFARGVCLQAVTHKELCTQVNVVVAKTPGAFAVTEFTLDDHGNKVLRIRINPSVIKMRPIDNLFMLTHEWTHADTVMLMGTASNYAQMATRAAYYYYHNNGTAMTKNDAVEVQTDCMAFERSGAMWTTQYPVYLNDALSIGTPNTNKNEVMRAHATCRWWPEVLYGAPGTDYSKGNGHGVAKNNDPSTDAKGHHVVHLKEDTNSQTN